MKYFYLITALFLSLSINAQELACNVSVNSSRIQGTNKQIFTSMQEGLNDFMNNTIWTTYIYEAAERVECNILVDITEQLSANEFKGKLQIQARRPVYASSYNSVIFNYVDDDVQFTYQEFDPIQFSENTFVSNLSSLMSFYAYIILGLDSDTFEQKGGEEFFRIAERIVTNAQTSGSLGWQAGDSQRRKNRFWLVENLLDSEYEPLRNFYYTYHRHGLDAMEKSADKGRSTISSSINELEKFNNNKPDPFAFLLTVVIDAKANEIVEIYADAPAPEKQRVKRVLTAIDPAGGSKYNKLD